MPVEITELEKHRPLLTGHCYRMLGSPFDADDAVQETMVRAWRALDRFDGRSSLKTWLHRIATNVCLDTLADRTRKSRPIEDGPENDIGDPLEKRPRSHWLEPVPDAHVIPADVDPQEQTVLRQSIRLAFVAALQHLPPKQRAVLLMSEVLGWSAAEVAETLETSVPSVNSALQRARATLGSRNVAEAPPSLSDPQLQMVNRYVEAFERYDIKALTALLTEDATLSMPPHSFWIRGHAKISDWMLGGGIRCQGSRLVPVAACGQPAFGQYRDGGREPWALIVLEVGDLGITSMTSFLDVDTLFPLFGLPRQLAA